MKAVDTNVLIRFLVRDDRQQAETVYKRFKKAEQQNEILFVPALIALEMIWVLESVYGIGRQEILDAFEALLAMPVLEFESQPALRKFINLAKKSGTDLPDLLIAAAAESAGCDQILTFDRRASKSGLFEILK